MDFHCSTRIFCMDKKRLFYRLLKLVFWCLFSDGLVFWVLYSLVFVFRWTGILGFVFIGLCFQMVVS